MLIHFRVFTHFFHWATFTTSCLHYFIKTHIIFFKKNIYILKSFKTCLVHIQKSALLLLNFKFRYISIRLQIRTHTFLLKTMKYRFSYDTKKNFSKYSENVIIKKKLDFKVKARFTCAFGLQVD